MQTLISFLFVAGCVLLAVVVFVVLPGCGPVDGDGASATPTATNGNQPVSFKKDVWPTFPAVGCTDSGCHGASSNAGGIILDGSCSMTHDQLSSDYVDAAFVDDSRLLVAARGEDFHPAVLTTDDPVYQTWRRWIDEGALGDCDTTN